ncbi:MAG: DUF3108 domain-containing protein [Campylobacterales bacterium]|nr:DUF3108 domain-containing protein [Campylobacterales bacterium]
MKTIVLLMIVLAQIAGAKVLSATYEVSYGIFDTMGTADARLEIRDDQTYTIRIEARTTGLAKTLSNNRIEIYESHGIVQNGRLVPQKYAKTRRTDSKKLIKIYTFDHANKTVWRETIEKDEWDRVKNDYYATDDILSLFFNFNHYMNPRKNRSIAAIGGNKKDGRIDVVFPGKSETALMKQKLEIEGGEFLKVILNDRIFASERGELLINLGSDGLCDKAILEDVLFFGDIVGRRVK